MSSLARPSRPAAPPAQATRQQLDELDALLQRMLDVPVHPGDGAAAAAAPPRPRPAPRGYPPSYMVVETNTPAMSEAADEPPPDDPVPGGRHDLVADDEESPLLPGETGEEEWVPFRSSWQPSAQTWGPLARSWAEAQGKEPPPEPAPIGRPAPLPWAGPAVVTHAPAEPAPPPRPPAPRPAEPAPGWRGGPLVWFNAAFDVALLPLGPVGRWLRGRAGRLVLGAAGVAALLAAAALAVFGPAQ